MAGCHVSLGVRLGRHGPIHRYECEACHGAGRFGPERWWSEDGGGCDSDADSCDECGGSGEWTDDTCECAECEALAAKTEATHG